MRHELQRMPLLGDLESPLVSAAGTVTGPSAERITSEVSLLARTGIGAITVGSFTVEPNAGNEARFGSPTYHHDRGTGKTYNSEGLPNIGKVAAMAMAMDLHNIAGEGGKKLIYSLSPTEMAGRSAIDQAVELAYDVLYKTPVDAVELNLSCPNVVIEGGERKPLLGLDAESMEELVARLYAEIGYGHRLGFKMPAYITPEQKAKVYTIANTIKRTPVARFVTTANAISDQVAYDENGTPVLSVPEGRGGMSGPATQGVGREQLEMWRAQLGINFEINSTLGVDSGAEVAERLRLGAQAVGIHTALWQSPNWGDAITKILTEYLLAA